MSERLFRLVERIHDELEDLDLDRAVKRAREGWRRAQQSGDDYYLDGVALNLHGFYDGLERLFELIAIVIDDTLPQGANWHEMLLRQMSTEVTGVRPAVISEEIGKKFV